MRATSGNRFCPPLERDSLCTAERRPIQFYPNEPCSAVKSKKVHRRVNGRVKGEGFAISATYVLVISSYSQRRLRYRAPYSIDIFHGNCPTIAEEKNEGSNTLKDGRGKREREREIYKCKRKKATYSGCSESISGRLG